jgi:undecaprenyl-diphosphatase
MLCVGLSLIMAVLVVQLDSGWMAALDTSVDRWVAPYRSVQPLVLSGHVYRVLGQPVYFAAAVALGAVIISVRRRSLVPASVLVATVGLGVVLENSLKSAISRSATAVAGLQGGSPTQPKRPPGVPLYFLQSFPSGHVTATVVLFGLVAVCLGAGRDRAAKAKLWSSAAGGVGVIAILAVYTRAHTITDVIGGAVLGAIFVTVGAAVLIRLMPVDRPVPVSSHRPLRTSQAAELARTTS